MSSVRVVVPDGPLLVVEVVEDDAGVVAHVIGEADLATVGRVRDAIEPFLGLGLPVVLDLSGVTFMDSSCLGVLVHARTTLTADGGSLVLRNPSRSTRRALTTSGLERLFETEIG